MGDDMIPIYLCEDNTLQLDLLKSMIEKYIFIQAYDMEIRQAVHTPHELLDLLPDQPENAVYFLDIHLHSKAHAELFDNRALAWLIRTLGAFPVQRDGKDIQSIKTAMQVLHKGENLLIFPEGTTLRGGVGYHDGLPAHAHAGIAMIGVRTGATLVPVFCDGQKKPFHKTRIIFGEPYVPEVTGRRGTSEELQAIADEMLRQAYALGGQQVGGAPL